MSESAPSEPHLAEVGRYDRIAAAREGALVVAARDVPYWIQREGGEWVLRVELSAQADALRELAAFHAEEAARPAKAALLPPEKTSTLSLYVVAWVMSAFFLVQNIAGPQWTERGAATSSLILEEGQWWRTITALTLHGDVGHLAANLAAGLLFAGFLLPRLGPGLTWLGVVGSGALGNTVNAWGYRGETHVSIGASTAVFGALGILVGAEFAARLSTAETRSRWQLVLPLGAGLGLLAYLGAGDRKEHIDFMAHFWGFATGLVLGLPAGWCRLRDILPCALQRAAGLLAAATVAVAWWLAWHPGK